MGKHSTKPFSRPPQSPCAMQIAQPFRSPNCPFTTLAPLEAFDQNRVTRSNFRFGNKNIRRDPARPLIWQQGALTREEKMLPFSPPADFLGTDCPPREARGKEGSVFTSFLLPDSSSGSRRLAIFTRTVVGSWTDQPRKWVCIHFRRPRPTLTYK